MKPYGHKRKDSQTCKYGCCALKGNPHANSVDLVNKAAKKRARKQGKLIIQSNI